MTTRDWILPVGAILAGIAVAAGAFGAHALEEVVSRERLATWDTAVRYHMMHALALLVLAALRRGEPDRLVGVSAVLFVLGTALFSGSLYGLVLADAPVLGMVTPLGGATFLAGWGTLAIRGISRRRPPRTGG